PPADPMRVEYGIGLRAGKRADLFALAAIVLLGLVVPAVFYFNAPVFFEGDARGYLARAVDMLTGDGLNFTLKRTPGYSTLVAGVFALSGPSLEAVIVVQHLLGLGTAVATFGCAKAIAGRAAALLAGTAMAVSGSALIYEQVFLSET